MNTEETRRRQLDENWIQERVKTIHKMSGSRSEVSGEEARSLSFDDLLLCDRGTYESQEI